MTNNKHGKVPRKSLLSLAVLMALSHLSTAFADTDTTSSKAKKKDDSTEVISVVGSRFSRSAADSAAPVDVFTAKDLQSPADNDMNDIIRKLVPSYNVQTQPLDDGSSFVRPAELRGLAADETLVLINGKRYHRSALVQLSGGSLSKGSQAPDVSNIPAIGLGRLDVLRDGAAAQYGSDAIAGVLNFVLRSDTNGLETQTEYGSTSKGDGDLWKVDADYGTQMTENGFLNVAAEITQRDRTVRAYQNSYAAEYQAEGMTGVADPATPWGTPRNKSKRIVWNTGLDLDAHRTLYMFGNYSDTNSEGTFSYRNLSNSIFTDVTLDDGSTFNFNQWFPSGFTPSFGADIYDVSQVVGLKGDTTPFLDGLTYDFSGTFGRNRIEYFLHNTVNPSLGPDSPTNFNPGNLQQTEKSLNADFTYPLSETWNLAFGGEYHDQVYKMEEGDYASWEEGDYPELGIGSNGYPGITPEEAGEWGESNTAAYVETEWDPTMNLMLGLAGRYEHYSDFGSASTGKLSARYNLTDNLVLRSTLSNGFMAPTPGQSHTTSVSTKIEDDSLVQVGTVAVDNSVAKYFGAKALKPEKSVNFSFGAGWTITPNLTATLDMYQIKVRDRIGISENFTLSDEDKAALTASGVAGASDYSYIRYFTNAFNTKTRGVDLVLTYNLSSAWGDTNFSLAGNYNKTEVTSYNPDVIDADRKASLENGLPKSRVNFNVTHSFDVYRLDLGMRYYGTWKTQDASEDEYQTFGSEVIVDTSGTWLATDKLSLTAGVQNLFDNYPDEVKYGTSAGEKYANNSPIGTDGTRWFVRANYKF
ncbi:TonB-dependent receptor plug domain-containing protein [Gallaecimonas mangrovi]|uniref:TonB-dependent receptor plug domain-containing protein n=1 Tax=Gallaecimonas mangrovi TaxID=2291597 RepID=UPI000E2098F6|nr:TonB-dependent receptor [Gallaecimonas mangrovi]